MSFDRWAVNPITGQLEVNSNGPLVLYGDYAVLEARCAKLEAERDHRTFVVPAAQLGPRDYV